MSTSARHEPAKYLGRITAAEAVAGASYRWVYTIQPIQFAFNYNAQSGTMTNDGPTIKAINTRELENTSTSVQGQNPSTLPSGFSFTSCAGIVAYEPGSIFPVTAAGSSESVVLFSLDNPVTGTCS